jgi:hypothetical protein
LVNDDCRKARERDLQCLVMEKRDAKQRHPKKDEIDRDSEHEYRLG